MELIFIDVIDLFMIGIIYKFLVDLLSLYVCLVLYCLININFFYVKIVFYKFGIELNIGLV